MRVAQKAARCGDKSFLARVLADNPQVESIRLTHRDCPVHGLQQNGQIFRVPKLAKTRKVRLPFPLGHTMNAKDFRGPMDLSRSQVVLPDSQFGLLARGIE